MQLEFRSVLRMVAFFVGGSLLGRALVRLPITPTDTLNLSCLVVGTGPILFFKSDLTLRYISAWVSLAGAAGILWLIGERLQGLFGSSSYNGKGSVLVATAFYLLLLSTGLLVLQHLRRKPGETGAGSGLFR